MYSTDHLVGDGARADGEITSPPEMSTPELFPQVWKLLLQHTRADPFQPLHDRLATKDIERYIDGRLRSGAAPATINRELVCLKTALRIGFERNLVHRLIRWKKLPELNVRSGFLDHDDYRKLFWELPQELKLLLVFGYLYGIRKTELLGYRWTYVDWFAKEFRVPQPDAKNNEPKTIPFYGDVESWLQMEKTRHETYYPESP
jgi:integrase